MGKANESLKINKERVKRRRRRRDQTIGEKKPG
jgi:hypothetical protein